MMSMDTPLISVIVPVYNVENYLLRCVKSIQTQTYRNIEIVLVDDGSPDRSGEICDEIAKSDDRVFVIHKKNGGLSDARNVGAQAAKGDWITFVDSDDWISPHMIERLWGTCSKCNAQVAMCSWYLAKSENIKARDIVTKSPMVMSGRRALRTMLYQKEFETGAWAKLYPADLIRKYPYPIGRLYEDLFTTYKILFSVGKVVYINEQLYFYWHNPCSIMNQTFSMKMFDEIDAVNEIDEFVRVNAPDLLSAAKSRKFSTYAQVLRWIPCDCRIPEVEEKQKELWKWIENNRTEIILDRNVRLKNRAAALCTVFGLNNFKVMANLVAK